MKQTLKQQQQYVLYLFLICWGLGGGLIAQELSPFAQRIRAQLLESIKVENMSERERLWIGREVTDQTFTDLEGEKLRFQDYQGKIIVLNFWNNKCPPCISEFPILNKIVEHYAEDKRILFWAFAANTKAEVETVMQKAPFAYRLIPDPEATAMQYFKGEGNPIQMIIDPEGKVAFRYLGVLPEFALQAKIEEQLALLPQAKLLD
ncbi:MAG: TlpA family protein disulfide reductase [Flavobacteriaceae bacterium]